MDNVKNCINLLGSQRRRNVFLVMYGHTYRSYGIFRYEIHAKKKRCQPKPRDILRVP
jgi:hypothetical protein